ncbi:virulence associated protein C (VapC)-like PIN domain [Candidatus Termititenax persephonae]|uniref:Virulence associated protein C (VapC)-like PIN domain n=1 Tax=Candidatus Termititenax persephonae TaxID=2218525 RepID=A0A388TH01_9BACT|nr:virulence associated protein C (VapC)-like PIN domain [Candidatus Termititenax persephonae]
MLYVLDASFCASCLLPDEQTAGWEEVFLNVIADAEVYVPQIWWYEMANIFRNNVKRKRLDWATVLELNQCLLNYAFSTDSSFGGAYTEKLLEITKTYDLTAYDAAYLELARRKNATVGTLDDRLKAACLQAKLAVL